MPAGFIRRGKKLAPELLPECCVMTRLSDRAYQIVKKEVDRYYSALPEKELSQDEHLERIILLARLETLREKGGKTVTKAQLWEEVCDILPNIDRRALNRASRVEIGSPAVGASLGLGAAGLGAAAVLIASPLGVGSQGFGWLAQLIGSGIAGGNSASSSAQPSGPNGGANASAIAHKDTFETAKAFGWQAALKGQDPPHSAEHWGETAALWQQAIALLEQIPRYDSNYRPAQQKRAFYLQNLQQIQARQVSAQNAAGAIAPAPQFSSARSSTRSISRSLAQRPNNPAQPAKEDALTVAKHYGWQAALASQNAPHPVETWANISKLWQIAIYTLSTIDEQHPSYEEAQTVKVRYEQNLQAIRQRYRAEQDAHQQLQSLQATLTELEQSWPANSFKRGQMQAIVERLQTIPANTVAHQEAQQLIVTTSDLIQTMPAAPPAEPSTEPSTQVAISAEDAENAEDVE